jgi:Flp pilus assembly protein TadD
LLYLDKTLYEEAIREFRRATFIDPKYDKAHNNLGVALLRSGKTDAAVTEFRWIVAQDSRNIEGLSNLALSLKASGRLEEAREVIQRSISLDAKYPPAHYNLALICEESGDLVRAIQHYESFLAAAGAENATLSGEVRARMQVLRDKLIR